MAKRLPLTLNIQHFAEEASDVEEVEQEVEQQEEQQEESKTFTQDQLEEIVKQRLARAEKDKEKAVLEAEKLAKMNADEKQKYEFEKLQRENEELRLEKNRYSMGREATKMLLEVGITADDDLLDFVVKEDAESTKKAVQSFSELLQAKVDEAVKDKLKGTSPRMTTNTNGAVTKDSIMSIKDSVERIKAIKENPHLFN